MIWAFDCDGTIFRKKVPGEPFSFMPGAEKTLRSLHHAGHTLILHSVRCQSPITWDAQTGALYQVEPSAGLTEDTGRIIAEFEEMRAFLREHRLWTVAEGGVFNQIWTFPGKPYADAYVDDRAIRPAWDDIRNIYGVE